MALRYRGGKPGTPAEFDKAMARLGLPFCMRQVDGLWRVHDLALGTDVHGTAHSDVMTAVFLALAFLDGTHWPVGRVRH